jgi:hypothetical protein
MPPIIFLDLLFDEHSTIVIAGRIEVIVQAEYVKKSMAESIELVKGMQDVELRSRAFEVIFSHLLEKSSIGDSSQAGMKKILPTHKPTSQSSEATLPGRIGALKVDDFFVVQRGIGEVREELKKRGWHHPVTSLSGPLQSLVQQKVLRREHVKVGSKKSWKYSNY